MKKIPTLYLRDLTKNRSRVTSIPNPECQWVFDGEGVATRKWDGTACLIRDGFLFKRYDCKNGKAPPPGFEPAQDPDLDTGHWPGWVQVGYMAKSAPGPYPDANLYACPSQGQSMADRWHFEVLPVVPELENGTYELCGPRINGNPEGCFIHALFKHGSLTIDDAPREFQALSQYLTLNIMEGIVFHHHDGRMAKIKSKDFGISWPPKEKK